MRYKTFLFCILFTSIFVFSACIFNSELESTPEPEVQEQVISDELEMQEVSIPDEAIVPLTDESLIKKALVEKDGLDPDGFEVIINKRDGRYVSGGVQPIPMGPGGGYFFAVRQDDTWLVPASGNGTISCEAIEPYDFPVEMIPECWDSASQITVKR